MATPIRQITLSGVLLLTLLAGCVAFDTIKKTVDVPPTGTPLQVVTRWQPYVMFAPDPWNGGTSTPGLAGRMYLFGNESDMPVAAVGTVSVQLFIDPPHEPAATKPLEVWIIDADKLQSRMKRDAIGWGYNLLLPWSTYRPELNQVRLLVRFNPANGGAPLYSVEKALHLSGEGPPQVVESTTQVRAAGEAGVK